MNTLSLRFIIIEHKFSYRLAFEIALIVFILVAVSGVINGISGEFSLFLVGSSSQGSSQFYLGVEQGKTLEDSKIPIQVTNSIDQTFLYYYSPILALPVNFNRSYSTTFFFASLARVDSKSSFLVTIGSLPSNTWEIMIGEGLASQLGISNELNENITFSFNNLSITRTVVGIFEDNSPWYYGFLADISTYWSNLSYISGFEFQIKNSLTLPAFEQKIDSSLNQLNSNIKIDYINLEQKAQLSLSFYEDMKTLFTYLLELLSILIFLKFFHSSYTLLKRLEPELWICRLIGMSDFQLLILFWQIIIFIGNIGIIFGIFLGLLLPDILLYGLKLVLINSSLFIVPSLNDILIILVVANLQFILASFLSILQNKKVKVNELF